MCMEWLTTHPSSIKTWLKQYIYRVSGVTYLDWAIPEIRHTPPNFKLDRCATDPYHLLHHTITREETQPRLKSQHPFATSGKDLSTTLPNETKIYWIAGCGQWNGNHPPPYITSPSWSSPGSDLPQQAWVKLNRLRTGVGRFNADMWRWGLSKSPACNCGADQLTANHIITECPLYSPPNGLHGSIDVDVDAATHEWQLSKFPEIWLFLLVVRFHT